VYEIQEYLSLGG